jgi:hypothetical protein
VRRSAGDQRSHAEDHIRNDKGTPRTRRTRASSDVMGLGLTLGK